MTPLQLNRLTLSTVMDWQPEGNAVTTVPGGVPVAGANVNLIDENRYLVSHPQVKFANDRSEPWSKRALAVE